MTVKLRFSTFRNLKVGNLIFHEIDTCIVIMNGHYVYQCESTILYINIYMDCHFPERVFMYSTKQFEPMYDNVKLIK